MMFAADDMDKDMDMDGMDKTMPEKSGDDVEETDDQKMEPGMGDKDDSAM